MSLKYVCNGPTENNPALIHIMAWHRTADKPLSEQMLASFGDAYTRLSISIS